MNGIEKIVYDLVKNNPELKDKVRNIYQEVCCIIPQKRIKCSYSVSEKQGYFFGFHDKCPWSFDNKKLLAHKFNIENKELTKEDKVDLGYFIDDDLEKFVKIGETKAWNWQQGAMLQWVGNENLIAYNYWDGNSNICNIVDLDGILRYKLSKAIGAIDNQGKYAIAYSFERLNYGMYGYGYLNENDILKDELITDKSGIYIIDVKKNIEKMLFSIEDIVRIQEDTSMKNAYHFFTHVIFNPSGNRFLFLHRWYKKGERLKSRLISSNLEGSDIHIFPTAGMVSHFSWIGNDKVIAFCNTAINGDGYHIFNDIDCEYIFIDKKMLGVDGHPKYSENNSLIVTDTYPNRFRVQDLIVFDYINGKKDIIGKFLSPKNYRGIVRCDLHPRWDREGKKVCVDSAHNNVRSICVINYER